MSVLTVTGTAIPDRTLNFPRSASIINDSRRLPELESNNFNSQYTRAVANKSQPAVASTHKHTRTLSSTISSIDHKSSNSPNLVSRITTSQILPTSTTHSRQPSTSTMNSVMQRQPTLDSIASSPRRSTSSRSTATNSPTSYVTLMRKQKATVWCDRSQNIDPRLAAQQKAAKRRAAMEVVGSKSAGRTSTINSGGVVGKIRHGGVPKAGVYVPANMSGAGVPMRLSANEMMGDDENEGRTLGDNSMVHARTGSGKSSTNSAKYRSGYPRPDQGRFSSTGTPPSGGEGASPGQTGIPEVSETPGADQRRNNYFEPKQQFDRTDSEESFGELKEMSGPKAAQRDKQTSEDLRRRGSVDERAMSMGAGVRLFVANPDLND